MGHASLLNAKSRFPVDIFSDQYAVSGSGSGGHPAPSYRKRRDHFEGDDAFPNSARPPLVNCRFRTLFQVSGCSQRFSFRAASVCFVFMFISTLGACARCPHLSVHVMRVDFWHIGSARMSLCHAASFLSSHSTFLPLLLCTGKPQSCGDTLTSFLAPISPVMTQRQFHDSLPHFTCVSFQHKLGGVRHCSGSWSLAVHHHVHVSFLSLAYSHSSGPASHSTVGWAGLCSLSFFPASSASLHQEPPERVLATVEVHLHQSICWRNTQHIITGRNRCC